MVSENLPCFSTRPCIISFLCKTLSAQTNPLFRSLAKYTRPNFPFPKGRPISNIPRWNSLGDAGSRGIETCICSILANSSDPRDDPKRGFGNTDPTGTIELGSRTAWEETNAILRRFDRLEFCTKYMLDDVTACLKLDTDSNGELKWIPLALGMSSFHCQDHSRSRRNSAKIVGARRRYSIHIRKQLCRTVDPQTLDLVCGFLSSAGSFSSLIETHLRRASRVQVAIAKIHKEIIIDICYIPQTEGDVANIQVELDL